MSTTRVPQRRNVERVVSSHQAGAFRLEELELRMLMSRGAGLLRLEIQPPVTSEQDGDPALVDSESTSCSCDPPSQAMDSTVSNTNTIAPVDTVTEPVAQPAPIRLIDLTPTGTDASSSSLITSSPIMRVVHQTPTLPDPVASDAASGTNTSTLRVDTTANETQLRPALTKRVIHTQVLNTSTSADASNTETQDLPTSIRPAASRPVADTDPSDQPTDPVESASDGDTGAKAGDQDGTTADTPTPTQQTRSCERPHTGRRIERVCEVSPIPRVAEPSGRTNEEQQASSVDPATRPAQQVIHRETAEDSAPQFAVHAQTPSGAPANALASKDALSADLLPQNLLADALTDRLADARLDAPAPTSGYDVLAAGVFAVAFTKPLNRLTLPDSSPWGDPSAPIALPFGSRRRRKTARNSTAGTMDDPEEFDSPDDSGPDPGQPGPEHLRDGTAMGRARASASNRYEAYDSLIPLMLRASRDDSTPESSTGSTVYASARSFAAGVMATAAAWLTLKGLRTHEREQLKLRPANPAYLGPTVLAAAAGSS